jgi:hypothetical protein
MPEKGSMTLRRGLQCSVTAALAGSGILLTFWISVSAFIGKPARDLAVALNRATPVLPGRLESQSPRHRSLFSFGVGGNRRHCCRGYYS